MKYQIDEEPMIPMIKKEDKLNLNNYMERNLLVSALQLTKKFITNRINECTSLSDEQQCRSCVNAVFVLKQNAGELVGYTMLAYLCFLDLQAFAALFCF